MRASIHASSATKRSRMVTTTRAAAGASQAGGAAAAAPPLRVVICGGGIVGASTAYFLTAGSHHRRSGPGPAPRAVDVTLVERHEIAGAASGKAGGFLALDWSDGTPLAKLARGGFALHRELARAFGAATVGYRPVTTLAVTAVATAAGAAATTAAPKRGGGGAAAQELPAWLGGGGVTRSRVIGTPRTTAQVHPAKLTRALWAAAEAAGARLVAGDVVDIQIDGGTGGARVAAVEVAGSGGSTRVPADAVVVALGPWSGEASGWLPGGLPGVGGQKAHSVVLRPKSSAGEEAAITPHCLFVSYRGRGSGGGESEPEVYPRPDGTVYACGESSAAPLPEDPAAVAPDAGAPARVAAVAGDVAECLRGAEVLAEQACYLPVTADGLPLIGRVPGVEGAFVGAGHGCWGILMGPITGLALAELIADGAASAADLAPFDPARGGGQHDYAAV